MAAEVGKPGTNWTQVSPSARKRINPIVSHYAKMAHPFTACVRDNTKRFGLERAKRVCAVVKDMGRQSTAWHGHTKDSEAVHAAAMQLADEALASLDRVEQVVGRQGVKALVVQALNATEADGSISEEAEHLLGEHLLADLVVLETIARLRVEEIEWRTLLYEAVWHESQHPRGWHGWFAEKGSAAGGVRRATLGADELGGLVALPARSEKRGGRTDQFEDLRGRLESLATGEKMSLGDLSKVRIERTATGYVTVVDGTRLPHKSPSAAASHALSLHRRRLQESVAEAQTPFERSLARASRRDKRETQAADPDFEKKHRRAAAGATGGGRFVAMGEVGSTVRTVQRKVGATVDGQYGDQTRLRVRRFQRRHGLTVDGVVGRQTATALLGHSKRARKMSIGSLSRHQVNALRSRSK